MSKYVKNKYGLDAAVITGSIDGRTTIKGFQATLNNVLTCFSPVSKGRDVLMPGSDTEIDILIATDCISEGQNLQVAIILLTTIFIGIPCVLFSVLDVSTALGAGIR